MTLVPDDWKERQAAERARAIKNATEAQDWLAIMFEPEKIDVQISVPNGKYVLGVFSEGYYATWMKYPDVKVFEKAPEVALLALHRLVRVEAYALLCAWARRQS